MLIMFYSSLFPPTPLPHLPGRQLNPLAGAGGSGTAGFACLQAEGMTQLPDIFAQPRIPTFKTVNDPVQGAATPAKTQQLGLALFP